MLEEQNEFVPQNVEESDRDYALFLDFVKGNKNLKEFSKDKDISYSSITKISMSNNWTKRRELYRELQQLQNISEKRYFIELGSNNVVKGLMKLNNKVTESLLKDIEDYDSGDKVEISKLLKSNMATLDQSIRLARLMAGMSDTNISLDNVVSKLSEAEQENNSNKFYEDYEKLLGDNKEEE